MLEYYPDRQGLYVWLLNWVKHLLSHATQLLEKALHMSDHLT